MLNYSVAKYYFLLLYLVLGCNQQEAGTIDSNTQRDSVVTAVQDPNATINISDTLIFNGTSITNFDSIKHITYLELYNPEFGNLPKEIQQLKNLKYIGLATNGNMTTIPPEIASLKSLKEIKFIKPFGIKTLPNEICQLEKLEKLTIAWGGNLKILPECIGNLTNLKLLDLCRNKLSKLPDSIVNLKNLEILVLWENPISKTEKLNIKTLLPNTKIYFDQPLPN